MKTREEIEFNNRLWYYKTYNNLILKCIEMENQGYPENMYTEVHHILPKCLGGKDNKSNLVRMPARYHIMAHVLLMKVYPDNSGLVLSAYMMLTGGSEERLEEAMKFRFSRTYEDIKIKSSQIRKITMTGENNPFYHKHHKDETKRLISEKKSGPNNPNFGRHHSKETIEKMRLAKLGKKHPMYGKHFSDKTRANMSKSKIGNKNSKRRKVIDSGNNIFDSIKECAKYYGIDKSTLGTWVSGKRKSNHGFRYYD